MKKIKSYTSIWKVEGVLRGIGDVTLPVILTYTQVCWLLAGEALVIMVFDKIPPLCYTDNYLLKYAVIPGGITWFMSKKTFDGKKPYSFLKSAILYCIRPKATYAGRQVKYEKQKLDEYVTVVKTAKENYRETGGKNVERVPD